MDAIETIMSRRSIRRYADRPVDADTMELLLGAAMAAPSAGNQRPCRFVVVTDRAQLALLSEASPYSGMLRNAPLAVVVCADTTVSERARAYWVQDCAAAMENLLLAAHAVGLGACWLGFHPRSDREDRARSILGLPRGIETLGVASIGHPAEDKAPADRYQPDHVHADRW